MAGFLSVFSIDQQPSPRDPLFLLSASALGRTDVEAIGADFACVGSDMALLLEHVLAEDPAGGAE